MLQHAAGAGKRLQGVQLRLILVSFVKTQANSFEIALDLGSQFMMQSSDANAKALLRFVLDLAVMI